MEIGPIFSALLRSRTGAVLIAAQVALTLAIVCNALFVVEARRATASRPSGVDEAAVFQLQYYAVGTFDDGAAMVQRDLETLRAIPGVVAAADVNSFPLSTSGWGLGLTLDPAQPKTAVGAAAFFGGESMVKAMGLRLIEGRDFTPADMRVIDSRTEDIAADSTIVSQHLARRLFPGASAVGKTIYLGSGSDARPMRVVGVVERLMSAGGGPTERSYESFIMPVRYLSSSAHYAVRTAPADRDRVFAAAEKALSALRSDRVLINRRTMDELRTRRYRHERAGASILVVVTIGLLLVTASGIVGIASLWVGQRRKQIGVRRALGARRVDILRYFLTENLMITTAGVVIGVGLAIGLNQYLVSHVELARLPLPYLLGGMLALWGLGLLAALGPAWRAASVPPAVATRSA